MANLIDREEMTRGFADGLGDEPRPEGERAMDYWRGWELGRAERHRTVEEAA